MSATKHFTSNLCSQAVKGIGYFNLRWLCYFVYASMLASLNIGNVCYLLYILNRKHINKIIASFQMLSQVHVQVHFWHTLVNDLRQSE